MLKYITDKSSLERIHTFQIITYFAFFFARQANVEPYKPEAFTIK